MLLGCGRTQAGKDFIFGLIGPWSGFYAAGEHTAGAVPLALEVIKNDNITFREINHAGHEFKFTWTDTGCNPSIGIPKVSDLLYGFGPFETKVDVIFGSVCSVVCEPGGYLAREKNVPMISYGCFSDLLSDKSIFPTFARTTGPVTLFAPAYVQIMQSYGYTRVALFTGVEPFYSLLGKAIRESLVQAGILVVDMVTLQGLSSGGKSTVLSELSQIRHNCKGNFIILRGFFVFVFFHPE